NTVASNDRRPLQSSRQSYRRRRCSNSAAEHTLRASVASGTPHTATPQKESDAHQTPNVRSTTNAPTGSATKRSRETARRTSFYPGDDVVEGFGRSCGGGRIIGGGIHVEHELHLGAVDAETRTCVAGCALAGIAER